MQVDSSLTVDAIMQGTQSDAEGKPRLLVVGQRGYTVADAQKLFLRKDFHHLPSWRATAIAPSWASSA